MLFRELFFLLAIIVVLGNPEIQAQALFRDSVELDEIDIVETKIQTFGFKTLTYSSDSIVLNGGEGIDELLKSQGGLYLKNYGFGGIASLSIRGGNAAQTEILWNGLRMNSPMLGQLDLSILPISSTSEISIIPSSASISQGLSGVAGSVLIENKPNWENIQKYLAGFSAGSFFDSHFMLQYELDRPNFSSSTYLSKSYFDEQELAKQYRFSRYNKNMLQQNFFLRNNGHYFEMNLMHLFHYTVLPSALADNEQSNNNLDNINLQYNYSFRQAVISVQSGLIRNNYEYQQLAAEINSLNRSISWQSRLQYFYSFNTDIQLVAGIFSELANVQSNNYQNLEKQNLSSVFVGLNWQYKTRLKSYIMLKESFLYTKTLPFQPSAGMEIKNTVSGHWLSKISVAKNFRLPTFNDLYWQPQGNPDLKPENGYSAEISQLLKHKFFHYEFTAFLSEIAQQIVWIPAENGLWIPINYQEVKTKGLESKLLLDYLLGKNLLHFNFLYGFTFSQVHEGDEFFTQRFIPKHLFSANLSLQRENNHFHLNYQFTGKRPIYDETYLLPQHLVSAQWKHFFHFKPLNIQTSLSINNLLNYSVEQMPGYPLAPRYFKFSLTLSSNVKK